MKNEKNIKLIQDSSIKGKSTIETITQDDKMKINKQSKKMLDIPSIKKGKNVVLYIKKNSEIIKASARQKSYKKLENLNIKKKNLNKVITGKKLDKKLIKNKTESRIVKSSTKRKFSEVNKTPSPQKKKLKTKKTLLIINSLKNKKDNKYMNTTFHDSNINYKKLSSKVLIDEYITIQNTIKNQKIHKNPNVFLGHQVKKLRKFSFDINKMKNKFSLGKAGEIGIKKVWSFFIPLNHIKKKNNNNKNVKNIHLNNAFTINNEYRNKTRNKEINKERNKSNEKTLLLKKLSKTKFLLSNAAQRNNFDIMRDKLITLSKINDKDDKSINSFTLPRTSKNQILNNKGMDEMYNTNNTFYKDKIDFKKDRNSLYEKISINNNYKTIKVQNYLKNENNNYQKKLSYNINNKNNIHHYLKFTVSSKNKVVKGKKIENNTNKKDNSVEKRRSNTIEKQIKLLKNKNDNKKINNDDIIQRNTINRFKLENQNNQNINNKTLLNRSTLPNITRINNNKINDYKIMKELGKGSYATVKLAIHKNTRNKYAIKIYSKKSLLEPQKKNTVNNEIKILKQLSNVNIVKLYDVIDTPYYLYLVMEYIEGISLLDTIRKDNNHYFEEKRAFKIFIQILKAMIYCQNKNICHRDIKLENILIKKNDDIKIIDFGFAVKTDKETYQKLFCGSPSYMAPEIVNKQKYIAQYSDIWSLGVLFFSMLFGRFPFKAKSQEELFKKINEIQFEFPEDIEINDKIKLLLKKIFVIEPNQRPSLQEILNEILLLTD